MSNVTVTQKITVTIGGQSHELTVEDARLLRNELNAAIPQQAMTDYLPTDWPAYTPWREQGQTISTDKTTCFAYIK